MDLNDAHTHPVPSFVVGSQCQERHCGSVVVTERTYEPDTRTPEHAHDYACLDVVIEGAVNEHYRGRPRLALDGGVLWYAPDGPHAWASGTAGARLLHIIIPAEWIDDCALPDTALDRAPAPGIAHRLRSAVRARLPRLEIESLAIEFWSQVRGSGVRVLAQPNWIRRTVSTLREDGAESLSLADLSDDSGVSVGHLTRVFRATVGCSPGEFTRRLRVHRGALRLSRGEQSITRLALDLGFADHAHFTRIFRRDVGCTPRDYRSAFQST